LVSLSVTDAQGSGSDLHADDERGARVEDGVGGEL
jgi:hypothetical protein